MKTSGNTVLITGGSQGIGLELATRLVGLGNTVLVTGRNVQRLAAAKAAVPALHTFVSDVSDPAQIAALHTEVEQRFPALNVLVNNAGIMRKLSLAPAAPEFASLNLDLAREVATNLVGPIQMVQQFLPLLAVQPHAAIVNVTSGLAFIGFAQSPIYCATKAALHSYTQFLRVHLQGSRVKVFELAPPATKTALTAEEFGPGDVDERMQMDPRKLVDAALRGLEKDRVLIVPGAAKVLRFLGRVSPGMFLDRKATLGLIARTTRMLPSSA